MVVKTLNIRVLPVGILNFEQKKNCSNDCFFENTTIEKVVDTSWKVPNKSGSRFRKNFSNSPSKIEFCTNSQRFFVFAKESHFPGESIVENCVKN